MAAVVCCCVISCNEKPKSYRFVKIANDGKEEVENIEAMYVISPDGDTLNTNEQLLEAVAKTLPVMAAPAPAPAAEPAAAPAN